MTQPTHVEAFIHAHEGLDGYTFHTFGFDMSDCGYIPVAKVEIPLPEITPEQIKARHLVLLRLERDKIYKKAADEAARLDERIAKLEALTYNPQPESSE